MKHRPWRVLDTRTVCDGPPFLRVEADRVELPDGKVVEDFYQIRLIDFAIMFAETGDGRILMIRQYKHGPRRVSLTLPGGHLDPGEDPLTAARRELMEETGYEAPHWESLGAWVANSNYGCGRANLFRATGAVKVSEPDPDDLEEMELVLLTRDELIAALAAGEICMLGHGAAIAMALLRAEGGWPVGR